MRASRQEDAARQAARDVEMLSHCQCAAHTAPRQCYANTSHGRCQCGANRRAIETASGVGMLSLCPCSPSQAVHTAHTRAMPTPAPVRCLPASTPCPHPGLSLVYIRAPPTPRDHHTRWSVAGPLRCPCRLGAAAACGDPRSPRQAAGRVIRCSAGSVVGRSAARAARGRSAVPAEPPPPRVWLFGN
jgi:hypothetical protein